MNQQDYVELKVLIGIMVVIFIAGLIHGFIW
jgi:hypothetical protein